MSKLTDLKNILEMLEDQRRDYNARNFGDAERMTNKIVTACNEFEAEYDVPPFEFIEELNKLLT